MSTCYVCFEECNTASPCGCKNMYLHPDCLETLRIYDHRGCTVCKVAFPPSETPSETPYILSDEDDEPVEISMFWYALPYAMRPSTDLPYSEWGEFFRGLVTIYAFNCLLNYNTASWYEPDPEMMWYSFIIYVLILLITRSICVKCYKNGRCYIVDHVDDGVVDSR